MGLSRTVSEINGDFSRKSHIFPTRRVFCAPAEGVPLDIVPALGGGSKNKTRMMGLPGRERSSIIFSRMDTMHQRDNGQTDGQTPDDSEDPAYA